MSKHNLRYLRNEVIEQVTAQRIREYESKSCTAVTLPVPVEQIIEQVLGLDFDWDEIEELPGEQILAGLDAVNRKILVNEQHVGLFEEKPGLYRSTIGHEAGHYDIDIDRAKLLHPSLPGMNLKPVIAHRHAKKSDSLVEVLLDRAATDPRAAKLLKQITEGQDTAEQKSAVDRYQSALLMPEWLMREAAANFDLTSWSVLYRLAEKSQVNISNLTVQLRRLGLIYLRDGDKTIYRSEGEERTEKFVLKDVPMAGLGELIEEIAEVLWGNVRAPQLPAVCRRFDMEDGEESEAYSSKRSYVKNRIMAWKQDQLVELAQQVEDTYPSDSLQRLIETFVPDQFAHVSVITRQHLLADLVSLGPLEGKLDLLDFLGRMWKLDSEPASGADFRCATLKDEIFQHVIRNDDYSYSDVLDLVGVPSMSNKRFIEFLEWTVHPLVRVDDEQQRYVGSINSHLKQDGLALVATDQLSGFPLFRVTQIVDGVVGPAKNLIFASIGPKPEIVFSDAVNNDIKIVKNAEHCLVFDHPFSKDGLLWKHLTAWWAASTGFPEVTVEVERKFYERLNQSLQSPPEHLLFRTYFERFRDILGERLPALIPQVYLHYDPYTARTLQGEKRIPRQRMDFLLLLSPLERVVIEVDGSQHYSEDGQASPSRYAEMVSADRDLRLAGYEVYRFGGAELSGDSGKSLLQHFFSRLFEKHNIRPLNSQSSQVTAKP